jgi:tripartite-type tricarboxylate transporter receptor subunit TctC
MQSQYDWRGGWKMMVHKLLAALCLLTALWATVGQAAYPDKPITLIVPYPPGGASDTIGRIMARGLSRELKQTVVVENKAGAGTVIAANALAMANPDGYQLLISSNTTFTVNPALRSDLKYDPLKSFESLGNLGNLPLVLLAHPGFKPNTLAELVALAKAQPGKLSYASFGNGTTAHLAAELFKSMAGLDILHVPYKGSAPAMTDLIGGQVQLAVDTNLASIPQLQAGKVKALGVTTAKRIASLPNVPTIAEQGYPGYEMVAWVTIVAPRGLSAETRQILSKAVATVLADPGFAADLAKTGLELAPEGPETYEAKVKQELQTLRTVVQKAGIKVD